MPMNNNPFLVLIQDRFQLVRIHWIMLERFLQHPLRIEDGYALPPERPGHGVAFDEGKVSRYCLEKNSWT